MGYRDRSKVEGPRKEKEATLNLSTEALARSSSRHPFITIGIWIALLVAAIGINATLLASALTTEFRLTNNPDSHRADDLLEEQLRGPRKSNEIVVVQSPTLTVDDEAFKERVESLYDKILRLGSDKVEGGVNYYQTRAEPMVSADRRTTIVQFAMAGTFDDAAEHAEDLLDIVRSANGEDGFTVLVSGEASTAVESNELAVSDIEQGERFGVPIALLILLVLFGAVVAAIIPIALAIIAIIMALGATALVGQAMDLVFFVTLMITMIGLAVGIDYSLIFVSRFREELRRGHEKHDAIVRTGATASRTVFFSGVTVVIALVGMMIVPSTVFQSLAVGAILVVTAAVAATLTLLPAVLTLLGTKVNAVRLPFLARRLSERSDQPRGGILDWLVRTVMRFPVISLIVAAVVMVGAASSFLDMDTGFNGVDSFPDRIQGKQAFQILETEFGFGVVSPAEIVISGDDVNSAPVQQAIEKLKASIRADSAFVAEPRDQVNAAGTLAVISVPLAGEFSSDTAVGAVRQLREQYIPAAFAGVDAEALVTGFTAFNVDFFDQVDQYTPIVFVFVLV